MSYLNILTTTKFDDYETQFKINSLIKFNERKSGLNNTAQ